MTVKECYAAMGGNYDDVMSRLRTDERVTKFLRKIVDDKTYELLETSLANNNVEEAFRAAHTIKGMCMNLSVTKLFESANKLTEALRGLPAVDDNIMGLFNTVKEDYELTVKCIRELA